MTLLIARPRINYKAREWCMLPYPDHPKGCPNYGNRSTCPPTVPLLEQVYNLSRPSYLVVVEFDLATHVRAMMIRHPDWTERQAKCVLYWQGTVNKQLRVEVGSYLKIIPNLVVTLCPEAIGLNVIATAQLAGVPIRSKPVDKVFKIAFMGELVELG